MLSLWAETEYLSNDDTFTIIVLNLLVFSTGFFVSLPLLLFVILFGFWRGKLSFRHYF